MARGVVMPRLCKIGEEVTIDACTDETHELANTITEHPVEEGANISDHCRPNADEVTLVCFISNTPLSTEQTKRAVQEGSVKFTSSAAESVEIGVVNGRAADAFKKLKKLRDEGTLFKLATTLKTYGDGSTRGMVFSKLSVSRTAKTYDGLAFTATMREIRII